MIHTCTRVIQEELLLLTLKETTSEVWISPDSTPSKYPLAKCRHTGSYRIVHAIAICLLCTALTAACVLLIVAMYEQSLIGGIVISIPLGFCGIVFGMVAAFHGLFAYRQIRTKRAHTGGIDVVYDPDKAFGDLRFSFKRQIDFTSRNGAWEIIWQALLDDTVFGHNVDELFAVYHRQTAEYRDILGLPGGQSTKYTEQLRQAIRKLDNEIAKQLIELYRAYRHKQDQEAAQTKEKAEEERKLAQEQTDMLAKEQIRIAEMRALSALDIIKPVQ